MTKQDHERARTLAGPSFSLPLKRVPLEVKLRGAGMPLPEDMKAEPVLLTKSPPENAGNRAADTKPIPVPVAAALVLAALAFGVYQVMEV